MYKHSFFNDYAEGAHPCILALLAETNLDQEEGYGCDSHCSKAAALLKAELANQDAAVHFISGGTQANIITLAALLKPYESVIAAESAHIHHHEAGAIEAAGHKINTVPAVDGKLTAAHIQTVLGEHTDEHMTMPRAVYISNSTELGTVYTRSELEAVSRVCRARNLYLYLDGARLGAALASKASDLTLPVLSGLVDVFYIGGTKNGALLGEALIINNRELQQNFRYHLKQRGALLAKGRLLGIQFAALFSNNLYWELAARANAAAARIAECITTHGFPFLTPPVTNQLFPVLPNLLITALQQYYGFYVWKKTDAHSSAVRLVTSWATPGEKVDDFIKDFNSLAEGHGTGR